MRPLARHLTHITLNHTLERKYQQEAGMGLSHWPDA
jgi:hypothetical protein